MNLPYYLPVSSTIIYSKQYWLLEEKERTAHTADVKCRLHFPKTQGSSFWGLCEVRVCGSGRTSNVAGQIKALGICGPLSF